MLYEIGRKLNFSGEGQFTTQCGLSLSSAHSPRPHAFLYVYHRPHPVSRAAPQTGGVARYRAGHRGRCSQDGTVHVWRVRRWHNKELWVTAIWGIQWKIQW